MLARRSSAVLFLLFSLITACGGTGGGDSTMPLARRTVDDDSYGEVRRLYLVLAPDDPIRAEVRERLVAHLARRSDALVAAEDYDGVVSLLGEMTSLLAPADLAPGGSVPEAVRPLARFLVDAGSRRGDEARVLAGLLLLIRIAGDDEQLRAEYERVATWGHDARLGAPGTPPPAFEHLFDGAVGILDVWEEHARLCPAPEVLERMSTLLVEVATAFQGGTITEGFAPRLSPISQDELRFVDALLERTPLEVAAVWLAQGDLEGARAHLRAMDDRTGVEASVRRVIETAMQTDDEGATALFELARAYHDVHAPTSQALCRLGVRMHSADARFPLCLARLTSASGEIGEGTAWYREAVRLAPDQRSVYDEALTHLAQSLEVVAVDESSSTVGQMRQIGRDAEAILAERTARWPGEPADVTLAQIRYSIGRAEMMTGNLVEARASFEASLADTPSRGALEGLASLAIHTGDPEGALGYLQQAMDRLTQQGRDGQLERAALLEAQGEAHRIAGRAEPSQAAYRQALEIYRSLVDTDDEVEAALVHVRLGTLVRRLGERAASDREYRLAMDAAPESHEPFVEILAHLVVDAPDHGLADATFRAARMGSHLEDAWKVYFALWVQLIAFLDGHATSGEAEELLAAQATHDGWHAQLAALGAGTTTYEQALAAASTPGQRCEAHFYAGARALALGDTARARTAFQASLETHMVGYLEYTMAEELLRTL